MVRFSYDFIVKYFHIFFSAKQKEKLRGGGADNEGSIISSIFEKFVLAMVAYFVISIINSLAQSYVKRIEKEKKEKHSD